jgi:hypothetical protein
LIVRNLRSRFTKPLYYNLFFFYSSQIQKEELRSLISSIKSLENCIQPFLDECDADKNDVISDSEWGRCLDLSESNNYIIILLKSKTLHLLICKSSISRRFGYLEKELLKV